MNYLVRRIKGMVHKNKISNKFRYDFILNKTLNEKI